MTLWHIAWSYLWNRRFTTFLTILSVALGVGLISTVLTLRTETKKRFEDEGQTFDLVLGAKGNPLQLVLSTIYYMDSPIDNIKLSELDKIMAKYGTSDEEGVKPEIQAAFPVNMGDSFLGYRIIGVPLELMHFGAGEGKQNPYTLAEGRYWEKPFEAVIGASVAEDADLKVGDEFISTHGLINVVGMDNAHEDNPYTIVGIMKPSATPSDRAIFCELSSVWAAHEHADEEGHDDHAGESVEEHAAHAEHEDHDHDAACAQSCAAKEDRSITAVLVKLNSPALRFTMIGFINSEFNVMAVSPVQVIQKLFDQLLGIAKAVLLAIGYLVVVISAISILIGLYMAILQRKRDLAIMRALGASKGEIFGAVIIEAFWVTVLGLIAGWFLGSLVCWVLGQYLMKTVGFYVSAISFTPDLGTAYSAVLLMGMIAGILPAWQAYRTNVAKDLAEL